jgi:primase-polymerase (primpol)-like protein
MKVSERVLNEDGTWSSFPEQLRKFQEFHGWTEPKKEGNPPEPQIEHGQKGKKNKPKTVKKVELD